VVPSQKCILTKDNSAKRNWNGCTKCCFCDEYETLQYLFFSCPFANIISRIVHTLVEKWPSIRPFSPQSIWLAANGHISPGSIENVGQGALVPVQICPIVHIWSYLQPTEKHQHMNFGCNCLAIVAQDMCIQYTWRLDRRLTCWGKCTTCYWSFLDGWFLFPHCDPWSVISSLSVLV
jgi:hypothetical protein